MCIWVPVHVQQKLSRELKVCVILVQGTSFIHCYTLVLCKKETFYRPQGKVMFSEASVILSTGRGMVSLSVWYHVPSRMGGLPQVGEWVTPLVLTSSGGHCSGRYVSYWNAFLFFLRSVSHFHVTLETRNFTFAFVKLCDEQTRRAQKTRND